MKILRKYQVLIYAATLSLVWAFAPSAQAKNSLNCTVVDETDKPLAKQELMLISAAGKQTKKNTNGDGEVKFGGLDDGSYTLNAPGLVPGKPGVIELSGNAEKTCKYTLVSGSYANKRLQEVMALVQQKKVGEAEEKAKSLVEMMPAVGEAHYFLAVAYAYGGKEDAGTEVKIAANLSPDKFKDKVIPIQMQSLNTQADQAKLKGDFPGAIKKYESMLAVVPNEFIVYYNMAVTYRQAGNFDSALKMVDKAIQLNPDDLESRKLKTQLQDAYLKDMDKKLEKK